METNKVPEEIIEVDMTREKRSLGMSLNRQYETMRPHVLICNKTIIITNIIIKVKLSTTL
jgi:hypothetical protein